MAKPGTAWLTRKVNGFVWGREAGDLKYIANHGDIAKLVLLDQWTRNCDRYRPEPNLRVNAKNVFLMREGAPEGRFNLLGSSFTRSRGLNGCSSNNCVSVSTRRVSRLS